MNSSRQAQIVDVGKWCVPIERGVFLWAGAMQETKVTWSHIRPGAVPMTGVPISLLQVSETME